MSLSVQLGRLATLSLALVSLGATVACGHSAQATTPSALVASPSDFDGQSVSVSGTAKDPKTRKTRRGQMTSYQLCDASCVTVVQFGEAAVNGGSSASVTGMFHASFGRVRHMTNVVVVGVRR